MVTVRPASFAAHESAVRTALGEYHGWVASEFAARLDDAGERDFDPEVYVTGELATDVDYLAANDTRRPLVLALDGDRVAGLVYAYRVSESEAELKRLYVREPYRGRGLGRQLVEALLDAARDDGYATVRLDTAGFMADARALYYDVGFEPYTGGESVSDIPDALRGDITYMRLALDGVSASER